MQLQDLIDEYELNLTFDTVQSTRVYRSKKQSLLEFIKPTQNIKEIDSRLCHQYIQHLKDKGNSQTTIRTKYSLLKNYLLYAQQCGYLNNIPYMKPIKKQQPTEKITVNVKDLLLMLKWCKAHNKQEARKALFIAYYTGARISNVLNIKPRDINNGYVRFWTSKGKSSYSVPIKKRLSVILNNQYTQFTINYQQLYWIFSQMKEELNIDKDITIHSFRHTFCSRCIEKGADLKTTQLLAGHKDIQTTAIYTHIKNKQLESIIDKL